MSLWNTTDEAGSKPKFLSEDEADVTVGVYIQEARLNRATGIKTPGWVKYTSYTDSQGNTRHKSEVLVAAASMTLDADTLPSALIKIIGQPVDVDSDGDPAVFTVEAEITPAGTITYQWQELEVGGETWVDMTGEEADTLTLSDVSALNGNSYRCVVDAADAAPVTSNAAVLMVSIE